MSLKFGITEEEKQGPINVFPSQSMIQSVKNILFKAANPDPKPSDKTDEMEEEKTNCEPEIENKYHFQALINAEI